ncbi:hypothetical protein STEG23_002004, partial [Scotinomys teguina]
WPGRKYRRHEREEKVEEKGRGEVVSWTQEKRDGEDTGATELIKTKPDPKLTYPVTSPVTLLPSRVRQAKNNRTNDDFDDQNECVMVNGDLLTPWS